MGRKRGPSGSLTSLTRLARLELLIKGALMKSVIAGLMFAGSLALAGTATVTVEGLHCASCKESVKKSVCGSEQVAKNAESCDVNFVKGKKNVAEIAIVTKEGAAR